jgi:hypothetical protein
VADGGHDRDGVPSDVLELVAKPRRAGRDVAHAGVELERGREDGLVERVAQLVRHSNALPIDRGCFHLAVKTGVGQRDTGEPGDALQQRQRLGVEAVPLRL